MFEPSAPVAPTTETPPDPALIVADEAFNTAMRTYETGGDATVLVKDALARYQALPTPDSDAQFHIALLQTAAGDFAAANTTCELLLSEHPNHLLAIGAAARAAKKAGDAAAARTWYQRYVDAWDQPREPLHEYEEHARLLTTFQNAAFAALAG